MAKAKVNKRTARKDYPQFGISKGDEHYCWDMVVDGKYTTIRSLTEPTEEQTTTKPGETVKRKPRKKKVKAAAKKKEKVEVEVVEPVRRKKKGPRIEMAFASELSVHEGVHVALDLVALVKNNKFDGVHEIYAVAFEPKDGGKVLDNMRWDKTSKASFEDWLEEFKVWLLREEVRALWHNSYYAPIGLFPMMQWGGAKKTISLEPDYHRQSWTNSMLAKYGQAPEGLDCRESALLIAEYAQRIIAGEEKIGV